MKISSWRWVVLLALAASLVGTTAALARQAPDREAQDRAHTAATAPGQVSPLAVGTFDSNSSSPST